MIKAKSTKIIYVPANRIWEIISDFGNIQNSNPVVEKSSMLSESNKSIGATRRCEFYDKTSVVEKVIDWKEGSHYTVELSETDMPLKNATATMSVKEINHNSSEISLEMNYTVKYGVVGSFMGILMMRPMMKKLFHKVLTSLEIHARTGNLIGKDGALVI